MSFFELIRNQERFLQQLLQVSQRQIELANEGNATMLNEHLGQREKLWNEFELLEQQLAPHKGIPPERRIWKDATERQLTEAALNRCKDLLDKIMANDQISLTKTAELKDKAEKDLRRVQLATPAASGYLKQSKLH
jgi:hypothetical protein